MSEPDASREPIEQLAESFVDRYRRGQRPSLSEYTRQYPELADQIRKLFPTLVMMEALAPASRDESVAGTSAFAGETKLERIGDFRILREVGRGGMGVVFEAEQLSLSRRVALKVLSVNPLADSKRLARFEREARAAARLHHTNIVPVFGVGEENGVYYYVMQFIQGQPLDDVVGELRGLRSGVKPDPAPGQSHSAADMARSLVSGASAGLATNTSPGDDGPPADGRAANVSPDGSRVVVDVSGQKPLSGDTPSHSGRVYWTSVARIGLQAADALEYAHVQGTLHRDIKPSNLLLDAHGTLWVTDFGLAKVAEGAELTRTGDMVGTLRYMAPERFQGRSDARSDIYSLGLTLYELVTLRPAFDESEHTRLIRQLAERDPPRPRSIDPRVPRDLETIVLKAIAKEPGGRYQAAGAMADDLRRFLSGQPIRARRTSPMERVWLWCRRKPLVAGLTMVVAVLLAAGLLATSWAALHFERLAFDRQRALDQRQQALDAKSRVLNRLQSANQTASERLYESHLAKADAYRWSGRLGQRLESLAGLREAVHLVPKLNKGPADVMRLRNAAIASLALADAEAVRTWESGFPYAFDGKFERYATWMGDGQIAICRTADDKRLARLAGNGELPYWIRFNADGSLLAAAYTLREPNAHCEIWDVASERRIHRVDIAWRYAGHSSFDFTPDGRSFVIATSAGELELHDVGNNEPRVRVATNSEIRNIAVSPDGRKVAASVSLPLRQAEVQIWDLDSRTQTGNCRYLADVDWIAAIAWTPDGHFLATGVENLIGEITLWDAKTGRSLTVLDGHSNSVRRIAFTPDGRHMVSTDWGGWVCLWSMASQQVLLRVKGTFSRLSDDGNQLDIFHSPALGRGAIYRLRIAAGFDAFSSGESWIDSDGRLIASGDASGVRLLDVRGYRTVGHLPTGPTRLGFLRPGARSIYVVLADRIEQWPMHFDKERDRLTIGPPIVLNREPPRETESLDVSADGGFLAAARPNRSEILVWNLAAGGQPVTLAHARVKYVALSPDGRLTATATWLGQGIRIWDSKSGLLERELWPESKSANVKFSPDGRWLIAWSGDEYRLWKVDSWEPVCSLARPDGAERVGHFAFTDDGRLLALPMEPGTIRMFSVDSDQPLRELATFEDQLSRNEIGRLALSSDGQFLMSPHPDGHEIWNLPVIRRQLAELGLDWDQPPHAPLRPLGPLQVEIIAAEPAR